MLDVEVRRDDLREVRVVEGPDPEPAEGEVVLAVERFGFTANNVTYAVLGDMLRYWEFFPREEGWGQIPVWGFGDVVASASPDLDTGARLFGYFPMSTHMRLVPSRVGDAGLVDASEHRAALPPAYNAYRFAPPEMTDDLRAILTPAFSLGFLVDDALEAEDDHGATTAVVSSASSKTAIATAFLLARRGVEVVGVTSPRNRAFAERLDAYAAVVEYDAIAGELPVAPSVYLDISGDAAVRRAVHERLGDDLRRSVIIGATHWEGMQDAPAAGDLPGPAPAMFFAPDHMGRRATDWGREVLGGRMAQGLMEFARWSTGWLRVERSSGADAVCAAYLDVLEGRVAPDAAHVLSL